METVLLLLNHETVYFQEKIELHRNALDFTGRDREVRGGGYPHALLLEKKTFAKAELLWTQIYEAKRYLQLSFSCVTFSFLYCSSKTWNKVSGGVPSRTIAAMCLENF